VGKIREKLNMKVILPAMDIPGDEDGVQRERN